MKTIKKQERGRPKTFNDRKNLINVRFSDEELKMVQEFMDQEGMEVKSTFLRNASLGYIKLYNNQKKGMVTSGSMSIKYSPKKPKLKHDNFSYYTYLKSKQKTMDKVEDLIVELKSLKEENKKLEAEVYKGLPENGFVTLPTHIDEEGNLAKRSVIRFKDLTEFQFRVLRLYK